MRAAMAWRICLIGCALWLWGAAEAAAPAPGEWLQVARLWTGDTGGREQDTFYTCEPAVYFFATLRRVSPPTPAAPHAVWLSVLNPAGVEVGRLGGTFALPKGQDGAALDFPGACASQTANGLRIGESLAARPGRCRVRLFVDGRRLADRAFTVARLKGSGYLRPVEAHLEDAEGGRRATFSSRDEGVYARLSAVNASQGVPHEHVVRVLWDGPQGPVGRALGGLLRVAPRQRLDGVDLPQACDAEGHEGLRICGTPLERAPGAYVATVLVDGAVFARLPFTIVALRAEPGTRKTLPPPTH